MSDAQRRAFLRGCLAHAGGHDKVAAPCLRAAGFLVSAQDPRGGAEALAALVASASAPASACVAAKVRWNACAGLARMLERPARSGVRLDVATQAALLRCVREAAHFRVRIAAVGALSSPAAYAGDADMKAVTVAAVRREKEGLEVADAAQQRYRDRFLASLDACLFSLDRPAGE